MFAKHIPTFAIPLFLVLILSGCTTASDHVKAGFYENDESITFGQAFAVAFREGVWSEVKNEKGEKFAQFTGKISPELHAYARGKLEKSADRIVFSSALGYLSALIRQGKAEGQLDSTINVRDYPISRTGNLLFDSLGDYVSSPDNQPKIKRLNAFYMEKYWASGSECTFQWKIFARGKMFQVVRMSNQHWDNDGIFSGKPENVLKIVFEYAKSAPR